MFKILKEVAKIGPVMSEQRTRGVPAKRDQQSRERVTRCSCLTIYGQVPTGFEAPERCRNFVWRGPGSASVALQQP